MATAREFRGDIDLYASLRRQGAVLLDAGGLQALQGWGGQQNFSPQGYTQTPGDLNRFLLESSVRSFHVDIAGSGSVNVFESGLWLVTSVYGFQDDAGSAAGGGGVVRGSLVLMSWSTGGEGLKGVSVIATGGYGRNVNCTHTAVNHDTASGALQISTTNGNTRTFFRSLRPNTGHGGVGPKGV